RARPYRRRARSSRTAPPSASTGPTQARPGAAARETWPRRGSTTPVSGYSPLVRAFALLLALGTTCSLASASRGTAWQPAITDAVNYASHRHGTIAFAVRTPTRSWGWHEAEVFPSASVLIFKGGWGS